MKFGFDALNQLLNNTNNEFSVSQAISQLNLIRAVRVLSIVLDKNHPRFTELGEWNGLGIIEYEDVINPLPSPSLPTARPLLGNSKTLPLINEIVYLIKLPDTDIGDISSNATEYYVNIVSLWNHPHHNAYPTAPNALPPSQQKDYNQTTGGNVRRVTDQSTEIFLGDTFIERSNIHPLLPFEGDNIVEGRWGNSVRLGSTVTTKPPFDSPLNNWSKRPSTSGDPILILRNGQGEQTKEGWIPVVEDINNDDASIYLTSTQNVPLEAATTNYYSYKNNPPAAPNEYSGKQVIVSSGRLVFNSSEDHILLSSAKSISLSSNSGVNVDTSVFTVQSSNIYLGSKNATEPLLLGNQTVTLLNQLIKNLSGFANICKFVSTPDGKPLTQLNIAAGKLVVSLNALQANLESLKSKDNFTI